MAASLLNEKVQLPAEIDPVLAGQITSASSNTFECLHALPGEIVDAACAVAEIKRDPVVASLLEPLETLGDEETLAHTNRVTAAAHIIGKRAGLDEAELRLLDAGSETHDIAKDEPSIRAIVQSDKKPEESNRQDFLRPLKQHPYIAAERIMAVSGWDEEHKVLVAELACAHHAYKAHGPYGKPAQRRPRAAKVLAIADTIDGLASSRRYKGPYSTEEIEAILKEDFGQDSELVEAALKPETTAIVARPRAIHLPQQVSCGVEFIGSAV